MSKKIHLAVDTQSQVTWAKMA